MATISIGFMCFCVCAVFNSSNHSDVKSLMCSFKFFEHTSDMFIICFSFYHHGWSFNPMGCWSHQCLSSLWQNPVSFDLKALECGWITCTFHWMYCHSHLSICQEFFLKLWFHYLNEILPQNFFLQRLSLTKFWQSQYPIFLHSSYFCHRLSHSCNSRSWIDLWSLMSKLWEVFKYLD